MLLSVAQGTGQAPCKAQIVNHQGILMQEKKAVLVCSGFGVVSSMVVNMQWAVMECQALSYVLNNRQIALLSVPIYWPN